jgi:nitroimidazol reductase NimA-like FMN-containing flavoprotein (pyridoxamine 5'-phosphate oxidase superfamily)
MTQQIILNLQFRDAVTGEMHNIHVTPEQWDSLVLFGENKLAEAYKKNGLKKDLK